MSDTAGLTTSQIQTVLEVSRLLVVATDLDLLLRHIADATVSLLQSQRASIFLHDEIRGQLWTRVATGDPVIRIPCTAGIAGRCFTQNCVIHVPDAYADPRFFRQIDGETHFVTRNLLSAPMIDAQHRPVGVVQALNKTSGFSPMDEVILQLLADQAGVAIQRYRLQQAAVEHESLRREMDLARQVQQAMIPRQPPTLAGVACAGWTQPASITGGDCYDLWRLRDGRLAIFLADASGHGMAPALVVSQLRTLVRALADGESPPTPQEVLTLANRRMVEDLDPGRFITAFLGFLDAQGVLTWWSAGQAPICLRTAAADPLAVLPAHQAPLGIAWEQPAEPSTCTVFRAGGLLAALSDGIFEAADPAGELFGMERVQALLDAQRAASPTLLLETLRQAVRRWENGGVPRDDQTMVILRRDG